MVFFVVLLEKVVLQHHVRVGFYSFLELGVVGVAFVYFFPVLLQQNVVFHGALERFAVQLVDRVKTVAELQLFLYLFGSLGKFRSEPF